MTKKILFITGTRADFGKIKTLMSAIDRDESFELHVLITGMHMLETYGSTHIEVEREGYKNIHLVANQSLEDGMSQALANTLKIVNDLIKTVSPDMIVVHGDRVEALAGAAAGALNNRLVCHIEGGELSGTIDDSIRHAVSKLAHFHMVANEDAKQRLMQMGERQETIFIIGSPDLDVMNSKLLPSLEAVKRHYQIPYDNYSISMFHPVTTEYGSMSEYTDYYFNALIESNKNYIVIYPNNDYGSQIILEKISNIKNKNIRSYPSISFESFLTLLKNCDFIIGNSSAGIREAPYYSIPSVNVGTRQNNRTKSELVVNCDYSVMDILEGINKVGKMNKKSADLSFGSGDSTKLFMNTIKNSDFWKLGLQKSFVDLK